MAGRSSHQLCILALSTIHSLIQGKTCIPLIFWVLLPSAIIFIIQTAGHCYLRPGVYHITLYRFSSILAILFYPTVHELNLSPKRKKTTEMKRARTSHKHAGLCDSKISLIGNSSFNWYCQRIVEETEKLYQELASDGKEKGDGKSATLYPSLKQSK